ncbi:hypothetical protein CV_2536 [Chromobacterium violaceum ATCC 12472]|uniref:Uncharacterized protein n=1 Tax=Chromobacterium violaceum (strain ATCC 12472 / DSM 30191 / JCM 1249 / CCUG 213 / NBRC 12614 / NCIMB 9131 / NCTC 9757 / MK) TaxID=243365 RepID=Q7NV10_CHRVO|nr:hypothetical protein CV_2536 [Chromobacterium violaceum ATCC 12472]
MSISVVMHSMASQTLSSDGIDVLSPEKTAFKSSMIASACLMFIVWIRQFLCADYSWSRLVS